MRPSALLSGLAVLVALVAFRPRSADAAPPHWTCDPAYYGDGWCDCGCGNYDIDCDVQGASLYDNCAGTYDCKTATTDPAGDYRCGSTPAVGVPSGWTCSVYYYDADDGCDCNCGEVDPDCADPTDTLYGCSAGQVCSPTGTCTSATPTMPAATTSILHFGGMCSTHFEETTSSKLNNTVYRVRLASTSYVEVDAWIDMKTVSSIPATYNQVKGYLDAYCNGNGNGNSCYIYAYSAGGSAVQYAINAHPNKANLKILGVRIAAGADGGSDLANWGRLAEIAACPMASTLTKSTQRNLAFQNYLGNSGRTVYRSGAKGHSAWAPWGWSSMILWAGSSQCSGEDDGAVGLDSSFGCTDSAGRSNSSCARWAGNVCASSGCPVYSLDHYEMKIKPMIEAGW